MAPPRPRPATRKATASPYVRRRPQYATQQMLSEVAKTNSEDVRLLSIGAMDMMALPFFAFSASLVAMLLGKRGIAVAGGLIAIVLTLALFHYHATDTLGLTF